MSGGRRSAALRGLVAGIAIAGAAAGCFVDLAGPDEDTGSIDWVRFEVVALHGRGQPDGRECSVVHPRIFGGPGSFMGTLQTMTVQIGTEALSLQPGPSGGAPSTVWCADKGVLEVAFPPAAGFHPAEAVLKIPAVQRSSTGPLQWREGEVLPLGLTLPLESELTHVNQSGWLLDAYVAGSPEVRVTQSGTGAGFQAPPSQVGPGFLAPLPADRPIQLRLTMTWQSSVAGPGGNATTWWYSEAAFEWEVQRADAGAP